MEFPWGILIALIVLGLALLIKHFASEVAEEDHHFWSILAFFFAVYIGAAIGIAYVSPHVTATAPVETESETVILNEVERVRPQGPIAQFLEKIKIKNVLP